MKAMAQRIVNAEERFIENVMMIASLSKKDAEKVLNVYRKLKIIKLDAVNGDYKIKHGAFYDIDTIINAVNY